MTRGRTKTTSSGESITYGDVAPGDVIVTNGKLRRVKEIITREKDNCLGLTWEDDSTTWRFPEWKTRRTA